MYSSNSYAGGSSGSYGYAPSPLECIVSQYAASPQQLFPQLGAYRGSKSSSFYGSSYNAVADSQPWIFLSPTRPSTPFIAGAAEIETEIRQAFFLTTQEKLPSDIAITVASREQLQQESMSFLSDSVVGLSLHDSHEIFVVAGSMAEVMLTVGHELGHVIRPVARTPEEEEAKAFAFEAAWARAIFDNDVGGLRSSIDAASFAPAKNGLHDVASSFVRNNISDPLQLFNSISHGSVTQQQVVEGLQMQQFPATTAATAAKPPLYSLPQQNKTRIYHGYLNKSRVQNLPPPHNFFWGDLGKGIYGMYVPMTAVETLNEQLLRKDLEQMHKTLGHEYSLHHVMKLPDGYAVEALEEAMFWTAEEEDRYSP